MEADQKIQTEVVEDTDAVAILGRYAMWHPEVEEKQLCAPCNHCVNAEHCTPCGSCKIPE